MASPRRGALAVVAAGILFGTTGTAQTFAPSGAEPLSVGAARLFLGGVLLGLIGVVRWAGTARRSRTTPPDPIPGARSSPTPVGQAAHSVQQPPQDAELLSPTQDVGPFSVPQDARPFPATQDAEPYPATQDAEPYPPTQDTEHSPARPRNAKPLPDATSPAPTPPGTPNLSAPASPTWSPARLPRWLPVALWVALGAGCVMAYQATFFAGTRANGVAVGTVVALGSSPLFAGLFEWLAFRRRPTLRWLVATGLAVLGVVLLAGLIDASDARADAGGLLASLVAGACYAGYTIATKALLLRGWGSVQAVSAVMAAGAALALPVLLAGDTTWLTLPAGIAVVAWLGVVTVVVTYLLIGVGLIGLPAATVATLTLAEPATATLLGVLVLHEPLGLAQLLGIVAVASGVLTAGLGNSHRTRTASP
ncbi:MAG: EamA family transporter [Propionicimonas sp.]|uniref:DMT family transporter n=1 Tax=Propionicimonas sp. TaxID=1955623 RepID=UPI002B1F8223|nr:EamA family transporter [Propionicimonas sp.]MEA4944747.1 EamA family transporter [Propionicimonas sp.]MEA5054318.1 EamA family transporter [Propionicimonas sp.]